jgi:hypothetical protein
VHETEAVAHAEERCVVCGRVELAEVVAAQTLTMRRFLTEAESAPAAFVIDARPRFAHVMVDGVEIGKGRVRTEVRPGEHRIRVTARGYDPQELTLPVTRGVTRAVEVRLTQPQVPQRLHRPLALGGLATAAVGIGVGAALVAADGEPVARRCGPDAGNVDADGDCRYVHHTLAAGVTMTALGVGLASAAATLLIIDASRRKRHGQAWADRHGVRLGIGRGGLAVSV